MQRPYERRTPAGLILPRAHVGLRGRVRWQVLDERGVPEIPRGPGGFPIGPADGVEQPNLLLNGFMDGVGTSLGVWSYHLRRNFLVGTGSTAPAVTDGALVNEVQRLYAGTAGPTNTGTIDTDANVMRIESVLPRQVTLTADRNLTEFGLGATNDSTCLIRELFRDEVGDPVTISLLNGKALILTHTLFGEIPAPVAGTFFEFDLEQYDATNTLVSTTPYDCTFGPMADSGFIVDLFEAWEPYRTTICLPVISATTYNRNTTLGTASSSAAPQFSAQAYTAGTYTRTKKATVPAATYGGSTWYGFVMTRTQSRGFVCLFDSPATYAKPSTDTVEIDWISSWARAA
ncbi:hypothetical protein [Natronococcus sp.]|uniref:hypothetical protein n=1 Tax=Natronococcus sp. TaxID=35747 RepID=UPI003A4D9787